MRNYISILIVALLINLSDLHLLAKYFTDNRMICESILNINMILKFKCFNIDITRCAEKQLEIPNAFWTSYSPYGNSIAYTTIADRFEQWKNYRGGTASRIWIYDTKSHNVTEIPKPQAGSN